MSHWIKNFLRIFTVWAFSLVTHVHFPTPIKFLFSKWIHKINIKILWRIRSFKILRNIFATLENSNQKKMKLESTTEVRKWLLTLKRSIEIGKTIRERRSCKVGINTQLYDHFGKFSVLANSLRSWLILQCQKYTQVFVKRS